MLLYLTLPHINATWWLVFLIEMHNFTVKVCNCCNQFLWYLWFVTFYFSLEQPFFLFHVYLRKRWVCMCLWDKIRGDWFRIFIIYLFIVCISLWHPRTWRPGRADLAALFSLCSASRTDRKTQSRQPRKAWPCSWWWEVVSALFCPLWWQTISGRWKTCRDSPSWEVPLPLLI